MFSIYGGATEFKQWELDKFVTNSCMKEGDEVVFRNSHGETYVVKAFAQGGEILADVPNYLLKTADNILVDLEQGNDRHPECRTTFTVVAQDKPDGYECKYNVPDRVEKNTGGGLDLAELEKNPLPGKCVEGMGWSETAVLLEESEAEAYTHPSFGTAWLIENAPKLSVGEIYTVVYNGAECECVCGSAPSGFSSDPDAVAMGNFSVAGGSDTGEPFAMLISNAQNRVDVIDLSGASEVKVKIYKETTHLIDQKLLGGQGYYYYSTPDCVLYKNVALKDAVTIDDMENVLACGKFREVYDGKAGGNIRFVGGAFFNPNKTKGFKVTTISVGSDGTVNPMELKSSDYKSAAPV